jgi:hypothetical protein
LSADYLENGIEARATLAEKWLVQAFSGQPGISRNLRHSFSASDVTKRFGNKCGIPVRLFEAGVEISCDFLLSSEVRP